MGPPRAAAPPPPRVILLDFGGTLAEPLSDMLPLFRAAARDTGLRVRWEVFLRETDLAWEELWPRAPTYVGRLPSFADLVHERALRRARAEGPVDATVQRIRDLVLSPESHPPFPETEEVLRTLHRRGYALHVLSNHTDYLPVILRNLGWSRFLEGVTYSQELGAQKPDPRLFGLALARARCAPAEALHVGDLWEADYRGAQRAGIPALWLNRTGAAAPDACDQIRDLRGLLARLPAVDPGVGARR